MSIDFREEAFALSKRLDSYLNTWYYPAGLDEVIYV